MGLFSSYPRISQFFVHPPTSKTQSLCALVAQGQVQLSMWDTKRQAGSRQLLNRGTEVVWDLISIITGWWFGTFFMGEYIWLVVWNHGIL